MTDREEMLSRQLDMYCALRVTDRSPADLYADYIKQKTVYDGNARMGANPEKLARMWERVEICLERYNKALEKAKPKPPAKLTPPKE